MTASDITTVPWLAPLPESQFDPGLYDGVPDSVYHGDRGSLSSSGARTLLMSTPRAFRWEQAHRVDSDAFDLGHVAHELILGKGSGIVRVDADSWRTTKAKDAQAAARAEGKVPLLAHQLDAAKAMADSVLTHPIAGGLFGEGAAEQSIWWRDEPTGVMLRARPDFIPARDDMSILVDLKTTTDANPKAISKSIAKYGYHIQQPWYQAGMAALGFESAFLFVFVDKHPPHDVAVCGIDEQAVRLGKMLARTAIDRYAECVHSNQWPGHPETIHYLDIPRWSYLESESLL